MADRVTERERVVVERDGGGSDNGGGNMLGTVIFVIVILLLLAFLFGWFDGDDEANDNAPVQQETQVEVPAGDTVAPPGDEAGNDTDDTTPVPEEGPGGGNDNTEETQQ